MDIKENKKSENKKTLFLVLGIFLVSLFIIGGTYAYRILSIDITNNTISYSSTCFDIVYDNNNYDDEGNSIGTSMSGTLIPSSGPIGGFKETNESNSPVGALRGTISIGLSSECKNIDAYGNFNLDITTGDNVFFQIVDAHCENSQTLRTLTKYTDQESCEAQPNGKWITNGTALKYAIYTTSDITSNAVPIKTGYFKKSGIVSIYDNFPVLNETVTYYVYVWLDGNLSDNSYASKSFVGSLSASVSQNKLYTANEMYYVVYSETDNSLRFYNDKEVITEGSTYNDLVATNVYTINDNDVYTYDSSTTQTTSPWNEVRDNVTKIVVEDEISPISTANWFNRFIKVSNIDVTKLNTSKVTDMTRMFELTGKDKSVTSFSIIGLNNWDVSNVVDMKALFQDAGYSATTFNIGDLSSWDVSNVVNMSNMFYSAGYSSILLNIGDLSSWDVSNVTNMKALFDKLGYNATTFNIGDLSSWDVSNVTNMYVMFCDAGKAALLFDIGNLDNWNVSKVTNMRYMFGNAGYSATTFNIGDLSSWDVSNVMTMVGMFNKAGYTATNWSLDLSGWNVNKVSEHTDFNTGSDTKVTAPTWAS